MIIIPNGIYGYDALNNLIKANIKLNGHNSDNFNLEFNNADYKVIITLLNNYQLDLSVSEINEILGFTKKVVTTTESGTLYPNITRSVDNIDIHCSLISDSKVIGRSSDILHTFSIADLKSSFPFSIKENNLKFHKINTRLIDHIRIYITNSLGYPLFLNNQPVDLVLT